MLRQAWHLRKSIVVAAGAACMLACGGGGGDASVADSIAATAALVAPVAPGSLRVCITTDKPFADAIAWDTLGADFSRTLSHDVVVQLSSKTQADIAKGAQPRPARPYAAALLAALTWKSGTTLRVRFLNGTSSMQGRVFGIAQAWQTHANVKLLRSEDALAEVRVQFVSGSNTSWSRVGKSEPASFAAPSAPTMQLGGLSNTSPDTLEAIVLHEFGHALGLVHELQHPDRQIAWDKPATYAYYASTYQWPADAVDKWVFAQYRHVDVRAGTYDELSIMHYPVPPELTLDQRGVAFNTRLSSHDVTFIRQLYQP